jgi:hypothetical protein
MWKLLAFVLKVLLTAFLIAFVWRVCVTVCVTVGVPVADYSFSVLFKNLAWGIGISAFLIKSVRWLAGWDF